MKKKEIEEPINLDELVEELEKENKGAWDHYKALSQKYHNEKNSPDYVSGFKEWVEPEDLIAAREAANKTSAQLIIYKKLNEKLPPEALRFNELESDLKLKILNRSLSATIPNLLRSQMWSVLNERNRVLRPGHTYVIWMKNCVAVARTHEQFNSVWEIEAVTFIEAHGIKKREENVVELNDKNRSLVVPELIY